MRVTFLSTLLEKTKKIPLILKNTPIARRLKKKVIV